MTKANFREETKLTKIWNRIIKWEGYNLATVQWHSGRVWKIVADGVDFDTITDIEYNPIAEFRTQEDLWKYIKSVA